MLRLTVLAVALAAASAAQPPQPAGPPPSQDAVALADRYLDALGAGSGGRVADAVRAQIYADDQPALLAQLVAFVEGPLYGASRPSGPGDGLEGEPADSALVRRYLEAYPAATVPPDVRRRIAEAEQWTELTGRPPSALEGAERPADLDVRVEAALASAESRASARASAERVLSRLSDADARALVAFYESDAGRYQGRVLGAAVADWRVAALEAEARYRRTPAQGPGPERPGPGRPVTQRVEAPPMPPMPPPPPDPNESEIFEVAEVQPQLVGGLSSLQAVVGYPELARLFGLEGQVVVQFVVDEAGAVVDPVVLRSPDELLSEAALEAVRAVRFTPGSQRGRPVKVRFAVPVTFRLR